MIYERDLSFNYVAPTKVIFGPGSLRDLALEVRTLGTRAFLVTDPGVIAAGLAGKVREALGPLLAGEFSDVPQDTGMEVVDAGAAAAAQAGADVVVSLGGGSVMDTAKGICLLLKEGGSLRDHQGMQLLTRPQTPHVAVPTTAGTGSEVSAGAVILDQAQGQKILIWEYHLIPNVALLDPELTVGLPPHLTASTGMDAMTHAVECYMSQQRNPLSDAAALHAIRLITRHLPTAVDKGSDLVARGQMQIAALLAGWAFSNALLGLVHAMAHSLGAVCRLPHGLANGLLLPHVMRFNLETVPGLMADVGVAMGAALPGQPPEEAGLAAVEAMAALVHRIGLPAGLGAAGVDKKDLAACAALAMTDGSIIYNPRMVLEPEEVLEVYHKAY
ncbi:MAG: iron-containing alcohol dehydrogenase [Thermodesulfobacteriota bacterium]